MVSLRVLSPLRYVPYWFGEEKKTAFCTISSSQLLFSSCDLGHVFLSGLSFLKVCKMMMIMEVTFWHCGVEMRSQHRALPGLQEGLSETSLSSVLCFGLLLVNQVGVAKRTLSSLTEQLKGSVEGRGSL